MTSDTRHAAELLNDYGATIWDEGELRVDVTDQTGLILFSVMASGFDGAGDGTAPRVNATI